MSLGGDALVADEIAIPGTLYSVGNPRSLPYDPATAKRLLAEAGYPNGFRLTGGMDWTTGFTIQDVVVAIQSDLKGVGIEIDPNLLELTA